MTSFFIIYNYLFLTCRTWMVEFNIQVTRENHIPKLLQDAEVLGLGWLGDWITIAHNTPEYTFSMWECPSNNCVHCTLYLSYEGRREENSAFIVGQYQKQLVLCFLLIFPPNIPNKIISSFLSSTTCSINFRSGVSNGISAQFIDQTSV